MYFLNFFFPCTSCIVHVHVLYQIVNKELYYYYHTHITFHPHSSETNKLYSLYWICTNLWTRRTKHLKKIHIAQNNGRKLGMGIYIDFWIITFLNPPHINIALCVMQFPTGDRQDKDVQYHKPYLSALFMQVTKWMISYTWQNDVNRLFGSWNSRCLGSIFKIIHLQNCLSNLIVNAVCNIVSLFSTC